jgi:hypothetical protein
VGSRGFGPDSIYYINEAGTVYEQFMRDPEAAGVVWWIDGSVPSRDKSGKDSSFDEFVSAEVHDCSDAKHRCVYSAHSVFAVPLEPLTAQSTYVAGGAFFRVEQCLREKESRCQLALISSDCRRLADPDRCIDAPSGTDSGSMRGRIGYFLFDQNRGVTAYGSLSEAATTPAGQMAAARHFHLRGRKGLLADGTLMPSR